MGAAGIDRRTAVTALATLGLAIPGRAPAMPDVAFKPPTTRFPDTGGDYVPPTSLRTVLDNFQRMTCPVTIQGTGPYGFVADTGANQSVIAAEIATALGLVRADDQTLNGVAGAEVTPTVKARLQLAERPERDVILSVLPAAAMGGQGMLGLDQLDGARLTLDFKRNRLLLDAGTTLPGFGPQFDMPAKRRDGQLFLVDAEVAGIRVSAFLDSGAEATIGNMALYGLAYARYPSVPWKVSPIVSVTGQTIDAQYADLPALRIGDVTLPTWPVAFANLHTFRMWNLIERPAILIGIDVLSRFQSVCLDFRRDEVHFRLPDNA
jgi:gag-polyprotein putative aspartyl protease/Aspartyl protease